MARKIFVYRDGKFVELSETQRETANKPKTASFIQDSMPPTWHPCDGKTYESKSAFRAVTKASGGEELGNDAPMSAPKPKMRPVSEDIRKILRAYEERPKEIPLDLIPQWIKDKDGRR